MLQHNSQSEKLEARFSTLFSVLQIGSLLRKVGIRKSFGMSSLAIFELLFTLIFQGRNWYRLLDSKRRTDLPGKDVVLPFP
ncbi:MAG: hypothetical protein WD469_04105 [Paenibacillaceae bacterium]